LSSCEQLLGGTEKKEGELLRQLQSSECNRGREDKDSTLASKIGKEDGPYAKEETSFKQVGEMRDRASHEWVSVGTIPRETLGIGGVGGVHLHLSRTNRGQEEGGDPSRGTILCCAEKNLRFSGATFNHRATRTNDSLGTMLTAPPFKKHKQLGKEEKSFSWKNESHMELRWEDWLEVGAQSHLTELVATDRVYLERGRVLLGRS